MKVSDIFSLGEDCGGRNRHDSDRGCGHGCGGGRRRFRDSDFEDGRRGERGDREEVLELLGIGIL